MLLHLRWRHFFLCTLITSSNNSACAKILIIHWVFTDSFESLNTSIVLFSLCKYIELVFLWFFSTNMAHFTDFHLRIWFCRKRNHNFLIDSIVSNENEVLNTLLVQRFDRKDFLIIMLWENFDISIKETHYICFSFFI